MTVDTVLRVARPVTDLARAEALYVAGLGLQVLARFADHAGFDGVILGFPGHHYHLELTRCRGNPVAPSPTHEDLAVFYLPHEGAWRQACGRMLAAGFREVPSFNPYWDARGRTFEDPDGYRTVLQNSAWAPAAAAAGRHPRDNAPASPAAVVQRQLDAYNARDIEAFLAAYAPDAQQFELHGGLLCEGRAQLRERMAARFAEPDLHAELLSRTVMGRIVSDHERVRRNFPEGAGTVEMLCLYEVEDGLIRRATFGIGAKSVP